MRQKTFLTFTADGHAVIPVSQAAVPQCHTVFRQRPGIHTQCHGFFAQRQTLIPDRNSLFTLTQRTLRLIQGFIRRLIFRLFLRQFGFHLLQIPDVFQLGLRRTQIKHLCIQRGEILFQPGELRFCLLQCLIGDGFFRR